MEASDCAGREPHQDLVKNEASPGREDGLCDCNGQAREEDQTKAPAGKREGDLSDIGDMEVGEKRVNTKGENDARSEIPAHHARRPPNGFLLFCKRHRDIVSAKNPNLENRGVTKLLGNWWRTLEEDERDKYKELARQNKEIFIANNPQFTWYKLPAPPLRTLVTRPSNRRPPKLEPTPISGTGPITPGKLADESQLGGLTSLLNSSAQLSPPTTPLPAEPSAPPHPRKRYLFQSRSKHPDVREHYRTHPEKESVEIQMGNNIGSDTSAKQRDKKKKNLSLKIQYKKNLLRKLQWKNSISGKTYLENEKNLISSWKSENSCTQQHLIERIVDARFRNNKKSFYNCDMRRTLDYIKTEHTYQKNPSRFFQQHQRKPSLCNKRLNSEKRELSLFLNEKIKNDGSISNVISPNLNNNTIILPEGERDEKSELSYSFKDSNNLTVNYMGSNRRKLEEFTTQTNHDRVRHGELAEDGYIPGGREASMPEAREHCDISTKSKDQMKLLRLAQVNEEIVLKKKSEKKCDLERNCSDSYINCNNHSDEAKSKEHNENSSRESEDGDDDADDDDAAEDHEYSCDSASEKEENHGNRMKIPKNCDSVSTDFQSILGKVSREIVSMMKDRDSEDAHAERMAVAKFNLRSKSETDSEDGSWYDKSDESAPGSPEGRRPKRLCKGQRYEQFIKDSLSKKRAKNSGSFAGTGTADGSKFENKCKRKKRKRKENFEKKGQGESGAVSEFLLREREFADRTAHPCRSQPGLRPVLAVENPCDGFPHLKSGEEKSERKSREGRASNKKKPLSKVQMIKEKREIHVGEFNLNEKIEELPLLSFESFLLKKRQRKKRLLGLRKDGTKNKVLRSRTEKAHEKTQSVNQDCLEIGAGAGHSRHLMSSCKPDFADLTTLAETALTLLSLREPR